MSDDGGLSATERKQLELDAALHVMLDAKAFFASREWRDYKSRHAHAFAEAQRDNARRFGPLFGPRAGSDEETSD